MGQMVLKLKECITSSITKTKDANYQNNVNLKWNNVNLKDQRSPTTCQRSSLASGLFNNLANEFSENTNGVSSKLAGATNLDGGENAFNDKNRITVDYHRVANER